jgi:hypothetical protein
MIKRACIMLKSEGLAQLHRLSSLPADWPSVASLDETTPEQVTGLIDAMAAVIADTWQEASVSGIGPGRVIPVCVAAYVRDGNPMLAQGGVYTQTNLVTQNLEAELGMRASAALNAPVRIRLLHDGTAAAAAHAGEQNTAVITVGTALGTGFPGSSAGLRPVREGFEIR